MKIKTTAKSLNEELRIATKIIKQANRGLPFPVRIDKDWELFVHDSFLSMRIKYINGDGKAQTYSIAL